MTTYGLEMPMKQAPDEDAKALLGKALALTDQLLALMQQKQEALAMDDTVRLARADKAMLAQVQALQAMAAGEGGLTDVLREKPNVCPETFSLRRRLQRRLADIAALSQHQQQLLAHRLRWSQLSLRHLQQAMGTDTYGPAMAGRRPPA
jgi:hypothetical protein